MPGEKAEPVMQSEDDAAPDWVGPASGKIRQKAPGKLKHTLPTNRVSVEKQLEVLRGAAAASDRHSRQPVANSDIAEFANLHINSISLCNPFFRENGFIEKIGKKNLPADEVFSFNDRYAWEDERAAEHLAPLIKKTWFANAILHRANFRPLSEQDALTILSLKSGAKPSHKPQLEMLLEYLVIAGLITRDAGMIGVVNKKSLASVFGLTSKDATESKPRTESHQKPTETNPDPRVQRFEIPIPGKPSAVIEVPKNLTIKDWDMLSEMLDIYIRRLTDSEDEGEKGSD